MGPSGAGKSTLLNALAGTLPASSDLALFGRVRFGGRRHRPRIAYVMQRDVFYAHLTVLETLTMAARLRLPRSMSRADVNTRIQDVMRQMGLAKVADTPLGDGLKVGGVSGGERKRVAIAVELLSDPGVVFADEPTTGLDSFQAERVMQVLKQLANRGLTVVLTIHQPRGSIFDMFDDLTVVSEEGVAYSGPAREAAGTLRARVGGARAQAPAHSDAEYVVDAVAIDTSSAEAADATRARARALVAARDAEARDAEARTPWGEDRPTAPDARAREAPRAGFGQQCRLLLKRSWRQVSRDRATLKVRSMAMINSALVFGAIFWRMGLAQSRIQDRLGLLNTCAINAAMASIMKTVSAFSRERAVVDRERTAGSYDVAPYFMSKCVAEIPVTSAFPLLFSAVVFPMTGLAGGLPGFARFAAASTLEAATASALGLAVGAVAPSPEVANALAPAMMLSNIVFGGLFVSADNVPSYLRLLPKASLVRHCFQGLCINEFSAGIEFEASRASDVKDGAEVLERFGLQGSFAGTCAKQAKLCCFYNYAAFVLLRNNKPEFAAMQPPQE